MITNKATVIAKKLLIEKLADSYCVLDATCGNGQDTLFLAKNTPLDAAVWAFDIQNEAIEKTRRLLAVNNLSHKVKFINESHLKIAEYIDKPVDAAMFNLGYLPGGDKELTTTAESAVGALKSLTALLAPGGVVSVIVYPFRPAGQREEAAISSFLTALPQIKFNVAEFSVINNVNNPPILYIIETREGQ